MYLNFKRVKDRAILPVFGHDDDTNAGVDFFACLDETVVIPPRGASVISTGVAWEPRKNTQEHNLESYFQTSKLFHVGMIIKSRSGLAIKENIESSNAGVIDEGYRGEIMIKLYNNNDYPYFVQHGQKVAQGVVVMLPYCSIQESDRLSTSVRGERGFGSSGR